MKNLRIKLIALTVLMAGLIQAQKPIQKTLVTSVNLEQIEQLTLDLEGRLEIQKWDKEVATIFIDIASNVPNERVMETLVSNGRYEIAALSQKENEVMLNAPNQFKIITVNGIPLEENVKYKIFIPRDISFSHTATRTLAGL